MYVIGEYVAGTNHGTQVTVCRIRFNLTNLTKFQHACYSRWSLDDLCAQLESVDLNKFSKGIVGNVIQQQVDHD